MRDWLFRIWRRQRRVARVFASVVVLVISLFLVCLGVAAIWMAVGGDQPVGMVLVGGAFVFIGIYIWWRCRRLLRMERELSEMDQ